MQGANLAGLFPNSFFGATGAGGYGGGAVSYFRVTLIKTAAIVGSGTLPANTTIADHRLNFVTMMQLGIGQTAIRSENSTCTVNTAAITIPLGNVQATSFGTVGATFPTAGSAPQNISLSCTATPSVSMTLQGTPITNVPNTVQALTAGTNTAQGIGVQLLYNNAALARGAPVVVSTAAGATLSVPVAARYYRFGNVTAGTANATATLRFDYN